MRVHAGIGSGLAANQRLRQQLEPLHGIARRAPGCLEQAVEHIGAITFPRRGHLAIERVKVRTSDREVFGQGTQDRRARAFTAVARHA